MATVLQKHAVVLSEKPPKPNNGWELHEFASKFFKRVWYSLAVTVLHLIVLVAVFFAVIALFAEGWLFGWDDVASFFQREE